MAEGIVNILLVEDDEVDIMNVQRAFQKNKITNPLYIARNGLEAIELLKGVSGIKISPLPKIILLDINMPKMNGIQATAAIKARFHDMIVIGLSVQAGGANAEAMSRAGAAMLITKEAAVDELHDMIQHLIAEAQRGGRVAFDVGKKES